MDSTLELSPYQELPSLFKITSFLRGQATSLDWSVLGYGLLTSILDTLRGYSSSRAPSGGVRPFSRPPHSSAPPSALRLPTGGPSAFHSTIPLASLLLRGKPVLGCPPCPPSSLCGNLHPFSVKAWMYMYFRFCGPHTISECSSLCVGYNLLKM